MLTFFSHCRAFRGEFDKLQHKAVESWRAAVPDCQVILMGNEPGTGSAAQHWKAVHLPFVAANEHGTALVSAIFEQADIVAEHDLLCEISSDIVLSDDFPAALDAISDIERPFVIGQRYDQERDGTRTLHPPSAADYFIFRRGTLGDIPPFAIGRTGYDNWLIWAAKGRWGMTVIDATDAITAVHQEHSYPAYGTREKMLQSAERQENLRLAYETGMTRWYNVTDAPFVLNGKGVQRRG